MIEWILLPKKPWEEIDEDAYLIYLPAPGRALTATHDAMNKWFYYEGGEVGEEMIIYPYRHISHYAHINLPWEETDNG